MVQLLDFEDILQKEDTIEHIVSQLQTTPSPDDFERLYNIFKDKIYSKCIYFVRDRDEAAELSNLVWIKINANIGQYRGDSLFATWIFRLCTNECLNYLKQRRRNALRFSSTDEEDYEEAYDPTDSSEQDKIIAEMDVTKALLGLSKESRALIILKYFDNYTYDEIADMTKLSPSAVKMKISRAKSKLIDSHQN